MRMYMHESARSCAAREPYAYARARTGGARPRVDERWEFMSKRGAYARVYTHIGQTYRRVYPSHMRMYVVRNRSARERAASATAALPGADRPGDLRVACDHRSWY